MTVSPWCPPVRSSEGIPPDPIWGVGTIHPRRAAGPFAILAVLARP